MSRLRFKVVHTSSEDAGYPADELNVHSPTTKGWKSAKYCDYPQELGFEFVGGIVRLSQVQILSHQALIATKIEVCVGVGGSSYHTAKFSKLGFLSLDSNERASFQARELKTVHVDQTGQYIKFLCHRNHPNKLNTHNQIGIVAVNFLGSENGENERMLDSSDMDAVQPRNALNDLSVDMNLDSATAAKLRLLAEAKSRAIASEDYLTAKEIKSVENELKALGGRLAQLDIAKREAVRQEDYDRAKEIKDSCDAIRHEIEQKVMAARIPGVTDSRVAQSTRMANKSPIRNYEAEHKYVDVDSLEVGGHNRQPHQQAHSPEARDLDTIPTLRGGGGSNKKKPLGPSSDGASLSEDRPIRAAPSGSYKNTGDDGAGAYEDEGELPENEFAPGQHPLEGVANCATLPAPKELTGLSKEQAESGGIVALIGEYRARCLFSVAWVLREAALNKTQMLLDSFVQNPGLTASLVGLMSCVRIGVDDKMQQVFFSGLSLLEAVLMAAKRAKLPRSTVAPLVEPVINSLIEKMSDANARIREGARKGMDLLSSTSCVGAAIIASHTLRAIPQKQKAAWRPLLNRLELLVDLIAQHGLGSQHGLQLEHVMNFVKSNGAFTHSNGDVREAAKEVTVAVQKTTGTEVLEPYLTELRKQQRDEYLLAFEKAGGDSGGAQPAQPTNKRSSNAHVAGPAEAKDDGVSPRGGKGPSNSSHQSPPAARKAPGQPAATSEHAHAAHGPHRVKDEAHVHEAHSGEVDDFTCNFCGAGDRSWDEDTLDLHYLKDCPLLAPCPACAQVLEIAALPDHLLEECEHKAEYVGCDVTGLAIPSTEFSAWKESPMYVLPPDNCFYCPLCLVPVEDSNEAWKDHLVSRCKKNTRTQGR